MRANRKELDYYTSGKHVKNCRNNLQKVNTTKVSCQYCGEMFSLPNIKKHESKCYLNPINKRLCEVCNEPIKNYKTSITCSYSCSNKKFRTGKNNGSWKNDTYRTTCFLHHKKECIVCGENKIVAVHHFDGNRNNNEPKNLIPLCPTHHHYWNSRYRYIVEKTVLDYVNKFNLSLV